MKPQANTQRDSSLNTHRRGEVQLVVTLLAYFLLLTKIYPNYKRWQKLTTVIFSNLRKLL